ncbi:MAG: chorismate synthase [Bacteroidetes bacterium]|nr:chorismate synthase [Bacteroidota bacterium]HET6245032.1 chorismate synthase [Bacteroidia bacterium]
MTGNSTGVIFKLTTFGESHGEAIGGVIDGCPAGLKIDFEFIQSELNRRKPGQSKIVSQRKENDCVEFLSGIFESHTIGTPIGFFIKNLDAKSKDYDKIKDVYRPSHADLTYDLKYGTRDYRGGGRSSARETASRVVAGAIAKLILNENQVKINAFVSQVGNIGLDKPYSAYNLEESENNIVRCPDSGIASKMIHFIEEIKKSGDTIGGIISCVIKNVPDGLGEPVFDKLQADLGKSMLNINAVKGFEYGSGFKAVGMRGSEHNDIYYSKDDKIKTRTNYSGGIQGGISNGEDIYFNVAFKPVATLMKEQESVNSNGEKVNINPGGRHDPCVVPRAVPIVEAMAAIVLVDHLLRNRVSKISNAIQR